MCCTVQSLIDTLKSFVGKEKKKLTTGMTFKQGPSSPWALDVWQALKKFFFCKKRKKKQIHHMNDI